MLGAEVGEEGDESQGENSEDAIEQDEVSQGAILDESQGGEDVAGDDSQGEGSVGESEGEAGDENASGDDVDDDQESDEGASEEGQPRPHFDDPAVNRLFRKPPGGEQLVTDDKAVVKACVSLMAYWRDNDSSIFMILFFEFSQEFCILVISSNFGKRMQHQYPIGLTLVLASSKE